MAQKGTEKTNIEASAAFLQYEEEIVNHPSYAGMPDLYKDDGTIQWETPSNRSSGKFQFSHDKRYDWWVSKAAEVGISTDEDKWISKVAKKIHPTHQRPCKVCGLIMDTRYCYLSKNFIGRVQKLSFYNKDINMSELMHIVDFVTTFVDLYDDKAFAALPALLKCKQTPKIPTLGNNLEKWVSWLNEHYIPSEPSMLGPGAMSNPPDRLDGFHTYNRCCRPTADKGRSKENLASYSTDRRAFENWSDGNWITANKLMGYINSDPIMKQQPCANLGIGTKHPRPCSADHIGPISLGFCHRPEFQLLCAPCNSAKNNRMYYSDVHHLINVEKTGEVVTTWYASDIWNKCKNKVTDKESALRLSRIMRDNRNIAMMLLYSFLEKGEYLFLLSLLNLEYADYSYEIISNSAVVKNHIVTVKFEQNPSSLKYVKVQKTRKVRIAFSALSDYAQKENRNGYMYTNDEIESIKQTSFDLLSAVGEKEHELNLKLQSILSTNGDTTDNDITSYLDELDYSEIVSNPTFSTVKANLQKIMSIVSAELESKWDDARYSREIDD